MVNWVPSFGAACHSTSTKVRDEGPFAIYYVVIYSIKWFPLGAVGFKRCAFGSKASFGPFRDSGKKLNFFGSVTNIDSRRLNIKYNRPIKQTLRVIDVGYKIPSFVTRYLEKMAAVHYFIVYIGIYTGPRATI